MKKPITLILILAVGLIGGYFLGKSTNTIYYNGFEYNTETIQEMEDNCQYIPSYIDPALDEN